ncbi:hypothetical protein [Rheinheimera texasensis]|jgi:hypothetical protein|uniref:hypothetical protein n=1 Tax=Rheinheimera texasensis TaxID=306205 RepID=UPI0012FEC1F1|nr:hypothetical protein [Rheinheimera texasensis]
MSDPVVSFVFFVWINFSIDEVLFCANLYKEIQEINRVKSAGPASICEKKHLIKTGVYR